MTGGPILVGGLLSGTSLDGIDAILLRVERRAAGQNDAPGAQPDALERSIPALDWEVVGFRTDPWSPGEREAMRRAMQPGGADARELARLNVVIGQGLAASFLALLDEAGVAPEAVAAVGSHGQTLWHHPPEGPDRGWTFQLGDAATLAELTGIPVVHDFRARDMAAGGHGAPLVPWSDRVLLHRPGWGRALQNLGGMGNVTFLPADGDPAGVVAFDTGPGVALLDAAALRADPSGPPCDLDGRRAARGEIRTELLRHLLDDPFFSEAPPRTTGRERFGDARLSAILEGWPMGAPTATDPERGWNDLLATLVELTAVSVARAYRDHLPSGGIDEVVLSGGGARNPTLVRAIEAAVAREVGSLPVRIGAGALGIDPDAREAAAFALLAWAHLEGVAGTLPQVTGARGPRVLGSLTPGRRAVRNPGSDPA